MLAWLEPDNTMHTSPHDELRTVFIGTEEVSGAAGREQPCWRPVRDPELARQAADCAPEAVHDRSAQRSERGCRSAVLHVQLTTASTITKASAFRHH